eukprot:gnl/TRDRNA2_/TRDRNA2_86008_c0_seq1.p1 gnl/TRDRNA2_/TRDRNA2_86008_c0~~gnl/TRDRNA2_/TRDRNA2_86008_c0_seq1.p1  ORF type:complete len:603 (-),score=114.26 gnl/TRDRNA2_/TRDRNA2_86008_c0_seq1:121-1929(-)
MAKGKKAAARSADESPHANAKGKGGGRGRGQQAAAARSDTTVEERLAHVESLLDVTAARVDMLEKKLKHWEKYSTGTSTPVTPSKRAADAQALTPVTPLKRKRTAEAPVGTSEKSPASAIAPWTPAAGASSSSSAGPAAAPAQGSTDPAKIYRCYDVLNVSRTATPEEVKRAFKRSALELHPDKPTGNHASFLTLQQAFEVIYDPAQRATYDFELVQCRSQDGLKGGTSAAGTPGADTVAQARVAPEMLLEGLLGVDSASWTKRLETLSPNNLRGLVDLLKDPKGSTSKEQKREEAEKRTGGAKAATPGIDRVGTNKYRGKISFNNIVIEGWNVDLDSAIDQRIALVRIRASVQRLTAAGKSFDAALVEAVEEAQSSEPASTFYLKFHHDFRSRTFRCVTPRVLEPTECLRFREELRKHDASGASPEKVKAENQRFIQLELQRKTAANRKKLCESLLREAEQLLSSIRRAGIGVFPGHAARACGLEAKRFKIISTNKVGVLSEPNVDAEVLAHLSPGTVFGVSTLHIEARDSRTFLKLSSGDGWVPQCSRKDASRSVVEEVRIEPLATALADGDPGPDEKGSDPDSDSDSDDSSSSSGSHDP